jgi:L-asparaginase / beta-aspartyl-peptidase
MSPIAIGIHGGCGTLDRSLMSEVEWDEARAHLANALRAGWSVLSGGGTSLDAVEAAVVIMEDSVHFNAGYGAALTADGAHELDASIMDGATLGGGAVCGVRRVRNPVRAARAVMEQSPNVLVAGAAADDFAASCGLDIVPNTYFTTERRIAALASLKSRAARGTSQKASEAEKHGTVGAVALDRAGNLAAATSTGGFNNKPVGRVGDSPILGAGTYARNGVCAVSGTGQGEIFIRRVAAYDVAARMIYANQSLDTATKTLVFETLASHKIGAGMIACDAKGNICAPYNTLGMYRGWVTADGAMTVATHEEEHRVGRLS